MRGSIRYFVRVKSNEVILREDKEGFWDLYDAGGHAAALASGLIVNYRGGVGKGIATERLAVEVVDCDGRIVIRLPINPAYQ
jgi:hypothetical protein